MSQADKMTRAKARLQRAELKLSLLLDRVDGAKNDVRAAQEVLEELHRQQ